ncbi:MAG: CPBP family intramembrane glutamic endopeptidase [Bacteroidota bacterium]
MILPKQPILSSLTPFTRVLFAILLMIACFAITFFLGLALAGPLFGVGIADITNALSDFSDPKTLRILKYFQVIQSFGLFILPPLMAGFFFGVNPFSFLLLNKRSRWQVYLITLVLMVGSLPFINGLVSLNELLKLPESLKWLEDWMKTAEEEAAKLTEAFMQMPDFGSFLFNLLLIAVLPSVGEELLFRGLFQRLFREWFGNIHFAIFTSAFLFSAMHFQFYGFLPRLVLGLMLGYLFYLSGSLWTPILAHFIQNGSVVVVTWLGEQGVISGDYENFGTTTNGLIIACSFGIILLMLWLIGYYSRERNKQDFAREDSE